MSENELKSLLLKAQKEIDTLNKKLNRYALNWNKDLDKKEVEDFFTTHFPVLKQDKSKLIGQGKNVLIEGDNLPSLIFLSVFNSKSFDIAPFDPPYNTGNTFTYLDNFTVKTFSDEDPDFSSKWLNMMAQRLLLLKQCLKDDGVVLINIDEYERANLELLCKMIFPKFIADLIWKKNAPKNNSKTISVNHEYILVFGNEKLEILESLKKPNYEIIQSKLNEFIDLRNKDMIPPEILIALQNAFPELDKKEISKKFPDRVEKMTEERISVSFKKWLESQTGFSSGDVNFDLIDFDKRDLFRGADLTAKNGKLFEILHPITQKPCKMPATGRGWAFTEDNVKKMIASGDILFGNDERTQPKKKLYVSSVITAPLDSVIFEAGTGKADLAKLGMNNMFDYAKPVNLIKTLLKLKPKNAKAIDIFAGSGTLGQAVVELNQEDGGDRSFVLMTNNESQICEKITYERLNRVMNGITFTEKGKEKTILPILDKGLSYFKVEFILRHENEKEFKKELNSHLLDIKEFLKYRDVPESEISSLVEKALTFSIKKVVV
jgi:adenine-specific DNA-methyltransferase